jgi:hypothetical protein
MLNFLRRVCSVALCLALALADASAADVGRAAYVKSGVLKVWDGATESGKVLATGLPSDTRPQWSTDGKSVLYWSVKAGHLGIQSVDIRIFAVANGALLDKWSIGFADEGAVRLAGVREIKQVGWYGPDRVYILGNISPTTDELRLFDAAHHNELPGYVGYAFGTCRDQPVAFFYDSSASNRGRELTRNGVPVRRQPPNEIRLIGAGSGCAAWYGLEVKDTEGRLSRLDTESSDVVAATPFADYIRMEQWVDQMVLFRPNGEIDTIDLVPSRTAEVKRAANIIVKQRTQKIRDFGTAYDWFP